MVGVVDVFTVSFPRSVKICPRYKKITTADTKDANYLRDLKHLEAYTATYNKASVEVMGLSVGTFTSAVKISPKYNMTTVNTKDVNYVHALKHLEGYMGTFNKA